MLKKFAPIIEKLENSSAPIYFFIASFLFLVTLRNFIEQISTHVRIELEVFLHYYLFYIALALAMILLFRFLARIEIQRASRVILSGFSLIILAPILDLIFTSGKGMGMTYFLPGTHDDLWRRFLTFGGGFSEEAGITLGIKIEIAIILIIAFIYLLSKGLKLAKSLVSIFLVYCLIFLFGSSPFIVKLFFDLMGAGGQYIYSNEIMSYYFGIVILVLLLYAFYFANKKIFRAIVKDLRMNRILYYILMIGIGLAFGVSGGKALNFSGLFTLIYALISLFFAVLFSIMTNNISDIEIDKISNLTRPLAKKEIEIGRYKNIALIVLALSLFYAGIAGFKILFFIALLVGIYFLYSMPPFRLKRVIFFSKLAISLNSLVAVMIGYDIISGGFENFPFYIWPYYLFGITAAANFIDLKDYEGDKSAGVKTLPVILGMKNSKIIIGLFFVAIYLSFYFLLREKTDFAGFVVFLLAGLLQFFLVNRKNYNEKPVFYVILLSLIGAIYLILK
jgi:4-hydroxybenzoate polyprenyltransferase